MLHNLFTISECLVLSQPRHPQYGHMYGVSTQKRNQQGKFKFQSCLLHSFYNNALGKGMNPLLSHQLWFKYVRLGSIALAAASLGEKLKTTSLKKS